MNINLQLAQELALSEQQVNTVINLINDGNTIPFIARYRKEMTGSLDDEVLRKFDERYRYLLNFTQRLSTIEKSIAEQDKLTDEIAKALQDATTLAELEDIYRPYKPKRETRGSKALDANLGPLSEIIEKQNDRRPFKDIVAPFIDVEKGINNEIDALAGALDIIAERIADVAKYRQQIRLIIKHFGKITTSKNGNDQDGVFQMYYDYQEAVSTIRPHRVLAINRGEKQKVLKVNIVINDDDAVEFIAKQELLSNGIFKAEMQRAIKDSYKRLIFPSLVNEIRAELTEISEDASMEVFQANLKQLLLEAPLVGKTILGFDPAFRTGCKLAVIDKNGQVLDKTVIYPTLPHQDVKGARAKLKQLITKYQIDYIALGNGTASRESEQFLRTFIEEEHLTVRYIIVSEAGASVYSASKLGAEEFPTYHVEERSAVSIARRLLDPLAELVKIDPKAIGVGQYQHDMNQKKLGERLSSVVEDCVNSVGVNVNNASISLLTYVSGISKTIAQNIVIYRAENGPFIKREQLLKVAKLGPKAYEQCAGFLRIPNHNPLDNTAVHPESYAVTKKLLQVANLNIDHIATDQFATTLKTLNLNAIASQLKVGLPTLNDIVNELLKPGRDPRLEAVGAHLSHEITDIKDLKIGLILEGTVRNIMDFGCFVDIGVHVDGLVHISEIANQFITHPLDAVSVNQVVKVKVIGIDLARKRISLSIKQAR
ncbi:MAG: Tex family protein [Bacilli bacterium]